MNLNHTSSRFDAQLEQLRAEVLRMRGAVEDQLSFAVQALQSGEMYLIEHMIKSKDVRDRSAEKITRAVRS